MRSRRGALRATGAAGAVLCLALPACLPREPQSGEAGPPLARMRVERHAQETCAPRTVPHDPDRTADMPDAATAHHAFPGRYPEQRDYLRLHVDGTYAYAERWGFGVPWIDWFPIAVGWDWKTRCTMHVCTDTADEVCCYQTCLDGGASGIAVEPPDEFPCMNDGAGGEFQWFIDGVAAAGAPGVGRCAQSPASTEK
jgi:hypothetical protein